MLGIAPRIVKTQYGNDFNTRRKLMTNNKQTMKLYTEEQVRQAMDFARGHHRMSDTQFIETLTPIELPSDEEIEQQSHIQYPVNLQPNGRTLAGGKYDIDINYSERNAFIECAKWMRDKIQGGNK